MSILTDPEIRAILTMLGAWVSGLGSLAAAGVALWLGYRAGRVKLKVTSHFYSSSHRNVTGSLSIDVTNLSERPVTISHVAWRVGRRLNRHWEYSPANLSSQSREKLEYGDTATFSIRLHKNEFWLNEFITDMPAWKHVKALRLRVKTSTGHTKRVVPGKDFLRKLESLARPKDC